MSPLRLGARLRAARERRGWTQAELAIRADVSRVLVGEVERDVRCPSLASFRALVEALGVSAGWVLGLKA